MMRATPIDVTGAQNDDSGFGKEQAHLCVPLIEHQVPVHPYYHLCHGTARVDKSHLPEFTERQMRKSRGRCLRLRRCGNWGEGHLVVKLKLRHF